MSGDPALYGLFFSALVSASLFPGGSEGVVLLMAGEGDWHHGLLWAVATLGNTLGGMTSWLLGWWLAKRFGAPRFLQKPRYQRALQQVRRRGSPILLFSWLPVIGDPLCLAAGWLQVGWLAALVFIAIGKALRYGLLLSAFQLAV